MAVNKFDHDLPETKLKPTKIDKKDSIGVLSLVWVLGVVISGAFIWHFVGVIVAALSISAILCFSLLWLSFVNPDWYLSLRDRETREYERAMLAEVQEIKQGKEVGTGTLRACPYCAELVQNEAIKCKHCGSEIETVSIC